MARPLDETLRPLGLEGFRKMALPRLLFSGIKLMRTHILYTHNDFRHTLRLSPPLACTWDKVIGRFRG